MHLPELSNSGQNEEKAFRAKDAKKKNLLLNPSHRKWVRKPGVGLQINLCRSYFQSADILFTE